MPEKYKNAFGVLPPLKSSRTLMSTMLYMTGISVDIFNLEPLASSIRTTEELPQRVVGKLERRALLAVLMAVTTFKPTAVTETGSAQLSVMYDACALDCRVQRKRHPRQLTANKKHISFKENELGKLL